MHSTEFSSSLVTNLSFGFISGQNPGSVDSIGDRPVHHLVGPDVLLPVHRHQHHPPVHRRDFPDRAELG